MSSRTIQNPGVELNEIDRSSYGKVDNSLPNSPTVYVMGFTEKGEDMTFEWINSKATLDDTFGKPTTEFEQYFYNAAMEVLRRGGTCVASKLPYENWQYNKFNYIDFNASFVQISGDSLDDKFMWLYQNDNNLTSYINIECNSSSGQSLEEGFGGYSTIEELDDLVVSKKSLLNNKIRIYDITRAKYDSIRNCECICEVNPNSGNEISTYTNECIGIVPVIVTPANALYFQNLLSFDHSKVLNKNASCQMNYQHNTMFGATNSGVQLCINSYLSNDLPDYKRYEDKFISSDWQSPINDIYEVNFGKIVNPSINVIKIENRQISKSANGIWKDDVGTEYDIEYKDGHWTSNNENYVVNGIYADPTINSLSIGIKTNDKLEKLIYLNDDNDYAICSDFKQQKQNLAWKLHNSSESAFYTSPPLWLSDYNHWNNQNISGCVNDISIDTLAVFTSADSFINTYDDPSLITVRAYVNDVDYNAQLSIKFKSFKDDYIVGQTYDQFNNLSGFTTAKRSDIKRNIQQLNENISLPIASTSIVQNASTIDIDSLSKRSASIFPPINFFGQDHFDSTNLKKIGVAVFKAFKDAGNSGKISFQLLESFVGSFGKNDRDSTTHASTFIDDIVNQNSQYIRFFSSIDENSLKNASTIAMSQQPAIAMGFYKKDCAKDISYKDSIVSPLNNLLSKASNPNLFPIDILVDAGVSNIAQLAKKQVGNVIHTDEKPRVGDYAWSLASKEDVGAWRAVASMLDNFCKQRKDCMAVIDGLRPMCLVGNSKIVRPTAPQNTVANSIIPKFRIIANSFDSSYSAGYCNWYLQQDYSNNEDYLWIPPSIKAMGVYIYCDTYFHPWSAPAGHTRGIVGDVVDIAFKPTDDDAGMIYSNAWNYAMSYPIDGIVIEGHKTFQSQRTALDRINVRRLALYLEKRVAEVARTFVYEQNTPYMRQLFVDSITPIMDDAVNGSGISDYAIKCDEELNTPDVIDNNELRCKIGIKPIKTVDWIVIDFILTNQSASVAEEVLS